MPPSKPCPHISADGRSCPELQPCPHHTRPANARWSRGRDNAAHNRFRRAVLKRDSHTCVRCGHEDPTGRTLAAHHVRPGNDPSAGVTLCHDCHRAVDPHAR